MYQNLLYTTWAATVIDMSLGNAALALACIRMRIPICIIVKNAVHREVLLGHLKQELTTAMSTSSDTRYYKTHVELGVPTPEPAPKPLPKRRRLGTKAKAELEVDPATDLEQAKAEQSTGESSDTNSN